jgi:hypothetical protein
MQIDLTTGYLFRPTTPDGGVKKSPLTSSAAEARLKHYLTEMKEDDGEMLHGFRSGCAITSVLTGSDLSVIMGHVGWNRHHTALYYLKLENVLNPMGASAMLATATPVDTTSDWQDLNELKRFVCAFPSSTSTYLGVLYVYIDTVLIFHRYIISIYLSLCCYCCLVSLCCYCVSGLYTRFGIRDGI